MILGVKSTEFSLFIPIKSRLTIIRGDSGSCKTRFISALLSSDPDIEKISELPYSVLSSTDMENAMSINTDRIMLLDDSVPPDKNVIYTFEQLYDKFAIRNNQYYVIIERSEIAFPHLSYSIKDILELRTIDGKSYKAQEMYTYLDDDGTSKHLVAEDSKGGFDFLKYFCNSVPCSTACGKANYTTGSLDMKNATAFLDTVAYGYHIGEFAKLAEMDNRKLFYEVDCFEEVLCLLCGIETELSPLSFKSKEKWYQAIVESMQDKELMKISHGSNAPLCLTTDCDKCYKGLYAGCSKQYTRAVIENKILKSTLSKLCGYHK